MDSNALNWPNKEDPDLSLFSIQSQAFEPSFIPHNISVIEPAFQSPIKTTKPPTATLVESGEEQPEPKEQAQMRFYSIRPFPY